jgi:hypothetical protein
MDVGMAEFEKIEILTEWKGIKMQFVATLFHTTSTETEEQEDVESKVGQELL